MTALWTPPSKKKQQHTKRSQVCFLLANIPALVYTKARCAVLVWEARMLKASTIYSSAEGHADLDQTTAEPKLIAMYVQEAVPEAADSAHQVRCCCQNSLLLTRSASTGYY